MTAAAVTVRTDGRVAVIRLARPERRNALDRENTDALADAVEAANSAGAIALLAEGEQFCVGGDVRSFAAAADPAAHVGALAEAFHRVVRALRVSPPVVVGVRGWAAGAGMSLVLACDVVVLGESAMVQPAYPAIGVTPDGGMSWTLPQLLGERLARSVLLRNVALDCATALRLGIADEVVPDAEVEGTVLELADRLAHGPRSALRGIKRLVAAAAHDTLDDHLDAEAASIAAQAASADGAEGIRAFVERRPPVFGNEVHPHTPR